MHLSRAKSHLLTSYSFLKQWCIIPCINASNHNNGQKIEVRFPALCMIGVNGRKHQQTIQVNLYCLAFGFILFLGSLKWLMRVHKMINVLEDNKNIWLPSYISFSYIKQLKEVKRQPVTLGHKQSLTSMVKKVLMKVK